MIDSTIPASIVRNVLLPIGAESARSMPPGMSGASLFRCRLASGAELALKRWPEGTARARIAEVHRLIQWSRDHGCTCVPAIHRRPSPDVGGMESVFSGQDGRWWDLTEWKPGSAATADASLDQVAAGAAAIAQFHTSVGSLASRSQPPPAVMARLNRIVELEPLIPQAIALSRQVALESELTDPTRDASQLVQWKWDQVRRQIKQSLNKYSGEQVPTQYVLRDVHRDHILFFQGRVTGLIDFDAVRMDTPATDLARWVGSFLAGRLEPEDVWEAAVAGFCNENTLNSGQKTEMDPNMAKDLCFASIWISLANWLVWIVVQQRRFPAGPKAVAARIRELVTAASVEG